MKFRIVVLLLLSSWMQASAQKVSRQVVIEHFTNSHCSVCANRNPGLYQNLASFPQVFHLSIFPSSPYTACPFSQYDKPAQDARTHYYGLFGATPQIAIQGVPKPNANFTSPALFSTELDSVSSFEASVRIRVVTPGTGEARLSIYKRDTSPLDSVWLYAVLSEDTVQFTSANGETRHYDVFRKAVWGNAPLRIGLPATVGDSVVLTAMFSIDPAWRTDQVRITALLQRSDRALEQAARSEKLQAAGMLEAPGAMSGEAISCYPNPATNELFVKGAGTMNIRITDLRGQLVIGQSLQAGRSVNIGSLPPGFYLLRVQTGQGTATIKFIKR